MLMSRMAARFCKISNRNKAQQRRGRRSETLIVMCNKRVLITQVTIGGLYLEQLLKTSPVFTMVDRQVASGAAPWTTEERYSLAASGWEDVKSHTHVR